jgi:hypothetical protein
MQQFVKWAQGQIVVRESTVADEIASGSIRRNLTAYVRDVVIPDNPDANYGQWEIFATICAQTVWSTGLTFRPETVKGLRDSALYEAYLKYTELPVALRDKWLKACENANVAYDIELGPEPLPETAEKKA